MRELILEKLKVSGYLPPLPDVLIALQKLMNGPDCDVEDVRRLISSDPVISSRIITMANSVLFGGGRDLAQNIEDAIVRLGVGAVLELCYTVELPNSIKVPQTFGKTRYWKHGLAVAILSRELGSKVLTDKEEKDQTPNLARLVSTANRIANKYGLDHPFETGLHQAADENYLETLKMSKQEMDELVDWAQIGILAAESVL